MERHKETGAWPVTTSAAEEFYERCFRAFESRTELEIERYCSLREDYGQIKAGLANLNRFLFTFHAIRCTAISDLRSPKQHHHIVNASAARLAGCKDRINDLLPQGQTNQFVPPTAVPQLLDEFGCVGHSAVELLLRIANRTIQILESIRPRGLACEQASKSYFWYRLFDDGAIDGSCPAEVDAINLAFRSWPEINPPDFFLNEDASVSSDRSNISVTAHPDIPATVGGCHPGDKPVEIRAQEVDKEPPREVSLAALANALQELRPRVSSIPLHAENGLPQMMQSESQSKPKLKQIEERVLQVLAIREPQTQLELASSVANKYEANGNLKSACSHLIELKLIQSGGRGRASCGYTLTEKGRAYNALKNGQE